MPHRKMGKISIWNYLRAVGLSEVGTAALMGNLQAESQLSSINVEDRCPISDEAYTAGVDNGTITFVDKATAYGYGLAQWTFEPRKEALQKFAKLRGTSIGDERMQLDFLMVELRTDYPRLLSYLQSTNDLWTATERVCYEFENPTFKNTLKRYSLAQEIYEELRGSPITPVEEAELPKFATEAAQMPILRRGDKGLPVGMAQFCLAKKGYNIGKYGAFKDGLDCDFGPSVEAALLQFKADHSLGADPVIDAKTWEVLYE